MDWMTIWTAIGALATVAAAIFAGYYMHGQNNIIKRQNDIIENQLKLDFINKRIEMYTEIVVLVKNICDFDIEHYRCFDQYKIEQLDIDFQLGESIFSKKVWLYIIEIQSKAKEFVDCFEITTSMDLTNRANSFVVRKGCDSKACVLRNWFIEQSPKLHQNFKSDLDLSNILH